MPAFNPGDRVAFAAKFLRSIGDYSHERAAARGTVIATNRDPLVFILWDGEDATGYVNRSNLIHADRLHLEHV